MARTPKAAAALLDGLAERWPSVKMEAVGEPDGFGVHRTVRYSARGFSKENVVLLVAKCDALRSSRSTALIERDGNSAVQVTFVGDMRASSKEPWPIAMLADADEQQEAPAAGDQPDEEKPDAE